MMTPQRIYRSRNTPYAVLFAVLSVMLAGCQPKIVKPPPVSAPIAVDSTGAVRYDVDSAESLLHVLVYRGGAMAKLGHNHVVSSNELSGVLLLHEELARSSIELRFPVNSLIVDDKDARAAEGEEFAAVVPDDAREGTRANLLRPDVLDGEHYAAVTLRSVSIAGTRELPSLLMRITIKDVARDVVVLAQVQEQGARLIATGEFDIQQTDFGIKPFSVAMGALQVQDRLHIRFRIVAKREP